MVDGDEGTSVYVLSVLAIELKCLPSQILKEDYNQIANIVSILSARAKKERSMINRAKTRRI